MDQTISITPRAVEREVERSSLAVVPSVIRWHKLYLQRWLNEEYQVGTLVRVLVQSYGPFEERTTYNLKLDRNLHCKLNIEMRVMMMAIDGG